MTSISTDAHPTHRHLGGLHVVRPRLPKVTCTPWCQTGDGHPGEAFPEDQACLSNLPGDTIRTDDGEVQVYLQQRHDGSPATVEVAVIGSGRLTPEQGVGLAHAVLATAALAAG